MPSPSVTHTFVNSTTADASQVNTNFTDLINSLTDGTKDLSINALTCAGAATLNGHVTLGSASNDDLTINASLASSIAIKTTNTYDIGAAALAPRSIYIASSDSAARGTRVLGGVVATNNTLTLPIIDGTFGLRPSVVSKTQADSPYTVVNETNLLFAASSASTVNLPAGSTGRIIRITNINALNNFTVITIDGNSTEEIRDANTSATTTTLNTGGESIELTWDGTRWEVTDRRIPSKSFAYTPTMTGFGTPSAELGYAQRVGNHLECRGRFTAGTVAVSLASISIPSGLNISTASSDSTTAVHRMGVWHKHSSTATAIKFGEMLMETGGTTTALRMGRTTEPNAESPLTSVNGNIIATNNEQITFFFRVPISGWNG